MTAAELIEILKKYPPDTEVQIRDGEDDYYQEPLYTSVYTVEYRAADFQNAAGIRLEGV